MIRVRATRTGATPQDAEAALARLDAHEGIYFGVDAGIAGLHPLQATLVSQPALRLTLWDDGAEAEALDAFGAALLGQPALAGWRAALGRGRAGAGSAASALDCARGLLACFEPSPDLLLLGALPFAAHRMAGVPEGAAERPHLAPGGEFLGVLYLPSRLLRRDAQGQWHAVQLALDAPAALRAADAPNSAAVAGGRSRIAIESRLAADAQANANANANADADANANADADADANADANADADANAPTPPAGSSRAAFPSAAHDPVPVDDHPPGGYADMVRRALDVLRSRPLVSLTLSQSYRRRVERTPSQAFARLRAANPAPACFFLRDHAGTQLFGASPDLQLVLQGGVVQALPVCGTVARRPGAQGEAASLRELLNEEVDAAALAVCSDALRNDLAPLCEPGSLRLRDRRRPMSLATVVHAVDRLEGRLRAGADAWDCIAATAAPVMLTGTPRAEALRAIAELEASPRGWYGGMVVQVASDGDALVGTILRAACVRGSVAEVRTGGDLLADSSPHREEAESRLKTRSLWRAFGLDDDAAVGAPGTLAASPAPCAPQPLPAAVRLLDSGDPFGAALRDCLGGLGIAVDARAALTVVCGEAALPEDGAGPRVALADAALRALAAAGAAVQGGVAEHGRALDCEVLGGAPLLAGSRFGAGHYASHRLVRNEVPTGWQAWARDAEGRPVALVRDGEACITYRPDSLLSDAGALALFAAALRHAQSTHPRTEA
ncbi:chorismate-binding protein [Ramlibacter sp. AN1015]|uniref:chorismate-binding protein n=1 Tax=Ramlibacter sp. AN1015 TaxID=3133428 RepID=UPI0030BD5F55